jgi:hypothetical protein
MFRKSHLFFFEIRSQAGLIATDYHGKVHTYILRDEEPKKPRIRQQKGAGLLAWNSIRFRDEIGHKKSRKKDLFR